MTSVAPEPDEGVPEPIKPAKRLPAKPAKRRKAYDMLNVEKRHGEGWPRPASSGPGFIWTGWLTHGEYNIIEFHKRYDIDNIYTVGEMLGLQRNSAQRRYARMKDAGILDGPMESFYITPMALILFDMTDQFILDLDLGDDE